MADPIYGFTNGTAHDLNSWAVPFMSVSIGDLLLIFSRGL